MLVEQAYDLISAHTTDDRALFLYASGAFQRLLGINSQVGLGVGMADKVRLETLLKKLCFNPLQLCGATRSHVLGTDCSDSELDVFFRVGHIV